MQPLSALRNYFELFWLHEIGTPMAGSTIAEPIESPPVAFSAENPTGLRRNDPPRLTNFDYYDKQRHEVRDEKSRRGCGDDGRGEDEYSCEHRVRS